MRRKSASSLSSPHKGSVLLSVMQFALVLAVACAVNAAAAVQMPQSEAGEIEGPVTLVGLETSSVEEDANFVELVIDVDATATASVFQLEDPLRLVVDFPGVQVGDLAGSQPFPDDSFIDSLDVSEFNQNGKVLTRVSVGLAESVPYELVAGENQTVVQLGTRPERSEAIKVADVSPSNSDEASVSTGQLDVALTDDTGTADGVGYQDPARLEAADARLSDQDKDQIRSLQEKQIDDLLTRPVRVAQAQGRSTSLGPDATTQPPEKRYTGRRVSFDLKNLDLLDFFREIANISGLNVVVDPDVGGTVSITLKDVPWDQALDVVLKNHGLAKEISGNIMRIATVKKLEAEERQRLALEEAKRLAVPLETKIFYLSYATPNEMTNVLNKQLSKRGEIIIDRRTNSLIVKDIPDSIQKIERLIEELDVRTRQVVIHSQIVQTTKQFTRSLGVAWNQSFDMDAEHGNTTGYRFPNEVNQASGFIPAEDFGATTPPPGSILQFGMTDILDTFRLQVALQASEAEGVTKTLANPRISTSDNAQASITSGTEIAYQVLTRDGPKTEFKQATISLNVTPHITADNHISMQVAVTKDSPDFSVTPPAINTNQASTDVLIKDGETLVIGGLNQSEEGTSYNKVPWLSDIPVLGWLFKGKSITNRFDDLLIFITPHIMKSEETSLQPTVLD